MPSTTRYFGLILIVLGIASYMLTGRTSVTALIPAIFGAVLVVCALIARNENARRHAMHAAGVLRGERGQDRKRMAAQRGKGEDVRLHAGPSGGIGGSETKDDRGSRIHAGATGVGLISRFILSHRNHGHYRSDD